jgi:hypothetical protein
MEIFDGGTPGTVPNARKPRQGSLDSASRDKLDIAPGF